MWNTAAQQLGASGVGAPGGVNFGLAPQRFYAQRAIQNALLGLRGAESGMNRRFQAEGFNDENDPGALGYASLGIQGLTTADNIKGMRGRKKYQDNFNMNLSYPYFGFSGPPSGLTAGGNSARTTPSGGW